ncbi:MAG TPA: RHS repeat-associated core domain-containing protein [Candidatus Angelobacter sp.]
MGVTDPLGNASTSVYDSAGRIVSSSDALGNTVAYQYNPLNLPTQVTDARGNNTTFSYDGNGNLLSLTDARNNATTYTYDSMDRVQTRLDPLLRQESYTYDLNGNIVSATDRKGQVTTFTYDPLNRLKFVGFNTVVNGGNTTYDSTISYTYDAGSRMTQAVDSVAGTITRTYDNLDRLTSETTPQGSITYGYDNAGRLTSMQVAGQPAVSYTYDNANRLTQITQGTSTTTIVYDVANRRASVTLSNNVVMNYTYDNASQLTGITYQLGSNTLGNLTYAYDSLGCRIQVGGAFARTGLPAQVSSATYDTANELTNWNGTAISFDANGNMLSDGINTFTWNARSQVATLNNVALQYDAFGRRTKNSAGTSFLYNGGNAVQELSGSSVTANLLSGGIDEVFTRADSSGSFAPLKDALGSMIALTDTSGNVQTSYTYDPFGNTSVAGTANGNEFQYTGRENEGNGLYYYRARYYSPVLHRFISEDPLGFGQGVNFYVYVDNNPTNITDPSGMGKGSIMLPKPHSSRGDTFDWWGYYWYEVFIGHNKTKLNDIRTCYSYGFTHIPGSADLLCNGYGQVVGLMPGAISDNTMNGLIVFGGGGLMTRAADGLAGAESQNFLPQEYYDNRMRTAPGQSSPYAIYEKLDEAGNPVQYTIYDEFGDRLRQFDIGQGVRHGEGYHEFTYSPINPRQAPGGGIRSPHNPF